ncbi:MAG: hypothetical protein GC138_03455 [Gammaproteobacteria bacterium]|nr:hypothetical protein [Gammaproteobacteria bacterium]
MSKKQQSLLRPLDEYIELDRTFHELSSGAGDSDDIDLENVFHIQSLSWHGLLKEYRTILLSEAGSGKTEEIRNAARRQRAKGKPAFFLRLEHIASNFEIAFEEGTPDEFNEWLESEDEGWILLDSVDEARLKNPGDFELAIRKMGALISSAKDRAHIIVTGRITAWRPKTDLQLCSRHLPRTPQLQTEVIVEESETFDDDNEYISTEMGKQERPPTFKIFILDDLKPAQVERFIDARGVEDTKTFMDAVERADAWTFTARPQDLNDLLVFWHDEGRIGSRLEIMHNSIDRRLIERDQDRAEATPLSTKRLRIAVRILAAATTLTKNPTIRVPDGADNKTGLPAQDILNDWSEPEISALLSRPIFDEAIYGAVRFHHRTVREYLTAEWFAELLKKETSRYAIESLFFREQYGITIVTPTLRPILPWLAILDDKICERIRKYDPEVLLEGGDPSSLPLEVRREILGKVCEQIAKGAERRSSTNHDAVQRFAAADLTPEIRELLEKYTANDDLSSFLLRMVWLGQLEEALPDARSNALNPTSEHYRRIAAFRAVKAVGSDPDLLNLRTQFASEAGEQNREWLSELIEGITSESDSIDWLLLCLKTVAPLEEFAVDSLSATLADFTSSCDIDMLPQLIAGLDLLLELPPLIERRFCDISKKNSWLLAAAGIAAERLITERHPAALTKNSLGILAKLSAARGYQIRGVDLDSNKLETEIPQWDVLNRALFWFQIGEKRQRLDLKKGERLTEHWQVSAFASFWQFDSDDLGKVLTDIEQLVELDDKLVALSLAFTLYRDAGRPRKIREKLKRMVAENAELKERLDGYLRPPANPEMAKWKVRERRWKKQREAREKERADNLAKSHEYLTANLAELVAKNEAAPGEFLNPLHYLFDRTRETSESRGRWTEYNWQTLIPTFGEGVALFYRNAAVRFWRHFKPTLRSEGFPANKTAITTIFGLVGIEIESHETDGWPADFTDEEVVLACRYASFELNGFPNWFPKLFNKYPNLTTDFLLCEIEHELSHATVESDANYILNDVEWSGQWAWHYIAPKLYERLRESEPNNPKHLAQLLRIVQGSSMSDEEISQLAAQKCAESLPLVSAARWFAVWTGVASDAAIPRLAEKLAAITDKDERTNFAMTFVTSLVGERRDSEGVARQAFQTASHLKTLYLLMHEHICREDDIERAGKGVYSPNLRDKAQNARNKLYEQLLRIPGKEGFLAIQEIAQKSPDRPWLARHPLEKAEQDGDLPAWETSAIREFNDKLEKTPTTHRELAELAVQRLVDLKTDLEEGDSSISGILRGVQQETDMRKFIGRELRRNAMGRYAVPQEEELADGKRMDVRFHGTGGIDAPVPIELKFSDAGWSGNDHFERLENQLCRDYLRDPRSTRGIFALVTRGKQKTWVLPNGTKVNFEGLVAALSEHWRTLSPQFPNIDDVVVIGIDLTKRGA